MKLRNKKTGQVGNFIINKDHFECVDLDYVPEYRNLAELNAEWEDYEEPEVVYYISWDGMVICSADKTGWQNAKAIGNYFETEEEAELAVQKLKALRRLKDKGISLHLQKQFRGDGIGYSRTIYTDFTKDSQEIVKDLDLLFGGEDE